MLADWPDIEKRKQVGNSIASTEPSMERKMRLAVIECFGVAHDKHDKPVTCSTPATRTDAAGPQVSRKYPQEETRH